MIVVLSNALSIVSKVNYVINVNEVTIIKVQQWINILLYMIKNWKHIPILQTLENVEVGANAYNIKAVILDDMGRYGDFTNQTMASKWICFRCDGDLLFQGIQYGVIS